MTEDTELDQDYQHSTSQDEIAEAAATSTTYKVLGEFADAQGAGVLGKNTAESGTPIGVEGAVPNTSGGYGLYTEDRAKVDSLLEVGDLAVNQVVFANTIDSGGVTFRATTTNPGDGDANNILQGHAVNTMGFDVVGGTVSGGGFDNGSTIEGNAVYDDYGTVGGGRNNQAGSSDATSNDTYATVGGGRDNLASGQESTVGGGTNNDASGDRATVSGGETNGADANHAAVGGGDSNDATGVEATVGGGGFNEATGKDSTIAGGHHNDATDSYATVGGGWANDAGAKFATIAGGGPGDTSDVLGTKNVVSDDYGTIGGGANNRAGTDSSDPGTAEYATVAGGSTNVASGEFSMIPGGDENVASGKASFAAGRRASASGDGSFAWGDTSPDVVTAGTDEFVVQAGGGVELYSMSDLSVGVELSPGSGTWSTTSSRTVKTDVESADPESVLEAVETLDVSTWQYDSEEEATHMGPMAEDFHDAFGLGPDRKHITNVDADGVALAAIQGLAERLRERDERIARLSEVIQARDERIEDLEARLSRMEATTDSSAEKR